MNAADIEPSKTAGMIANLKGPAALLWAPTFGLFEMEVDMNRTVLAAAVTLGLLAGASLVPRPAEAMPTASAGLATTATTNPLALDVAYVCRRVWRCGPYGCGWRRACYYTRPYHPYRYYRRHFYYRRW